MTVAGLPFLTHWQNFYVIMGTAAATLMGLMFVASTLIAGIDRHVSTLNAGISAFNAPTMVHFCAVLLVAAILSAPWKAFKDISLLLGLAGLGTVVYLITVIRRMRHVPGYQTPLKDWLWYLTFPLIAFIVLILAAVALPAKPDVGLYTISAVMVVLLLIGIHNSWDLITYLSVERSHPEQM